MGCRSHKRLEDVVSSVGTSLRHNIVDVELFGEHVETSEEATTLGDPPNSPENCSGRSKPNATGGPLERRRWPWPRYRLLPRTRPRDRYRVSNWTSVTGPSQEIMIHGHMVRPKDGFYAVDRFGPFGVLKASSVVGAVIIRVCSTIDVILAVPVGPRGLIRTACRIPRATVARWGYQGYSGRSWQGMDVTTGSQYAIPLSQTFITRIVQPPKTE